MTVATFGGKPLVLRCSRCGKFVDWADARLQVVCGCRPHLDLAPVLIREAAGDERRIALDLFARDFGHTHVVALGQPIDLGAAPALVAEMEGDVAGALAYRVLPDGLQILALATDPTWQRSGVGGYLVAEVELLARCKALGKVSVSATNDNLPALYFYQRRGYRIMEVVPHGMEGHSAAPAVEGFGGIPVRDEIRLAKILG